MDTISLSAGRTRVLVAPQAGGRVVQIEILDGGGWLPLLVAPDDLRTLIEEPLLWGCYPMTPWPGRVDHARFEWQGVSHELPVNDGEHSIHGRGVYLPWTIAAADGASCQLALELGRESAWPFACRLIQAIRVEDDGVRLALSIVSESPVPFPLGMGWHPWFRRDVRPDARPAIQVIADVHYEARADLIPTGSVSKPGGEADLSDGPEIDGRMLDDFYAGVREPMEVRWGDLRLTMTSGENCRHAVVYTQSDRGFCVEPQTCAPDAFNMAARGVEDTGMSVVEPGETAIAHTEWRWSVG